MIFNCSEQLSGIAEANIYLLEETSNWPKILRDNNASQIEFNPEPVSVEALIKPDTIKINTQKKKDSSGTTYQITLKLEFITRSESLEQLLDQYENKPVVFILSFNNDFQKLYGTDKEPLYLTYEVEEGDKIDSESGTSIEIKGETRQRPVFYTV